MNSMHSEIVVDHSSEHKLATSGKDKMDLDNPCFKSEDSDDSDDGKPLSSKFSPSVVVEKTSSLHAKKVPESPRHTSLSSQQVKERTKEDSDDSEDNKPLLSRFQRKFIAHLKNSRLQEKVMEMVSLTCWIRVSLMLI